MLAVQKINPLMRAFFVVGGVAAIVTGTTYAMLSSSSASLVGSTMSSDTAELLVSKNGTTFGDERAGFPFADIVPGGDPAPADGNAFWLRNTSTGVDLALTVGIPELPVFDPAGLDLNKVHVVITDPGADGLLDGTDDEEVLRASITDLVAGPEPILGELVAGADRKLFIQAVMDAGTFEGTSGSVGAFDLVFNGTNAAEVTP